MLPCQVYQIIVLAPNESFFAINAHFTHIFALAADFQTPSSSITLYRKLNNEANNTFTPTIRNFSNYDPTTITTKPKLRSFANSTLTVVLFTDLRLTIYPDFRLSMVEVNLSADPEFSRISEVCFAANQSQILVLIETTVGCYRLIQIVNGSRNRVLDIDVSVNVAANRIYRMLYHRGILYASTQNKTLVFSIDSGFIYSRYFQVNVYTNYSQYVSLAADGMYVIYINGFIGSIVDTTNAPNQYICANFFSTNISGWAMQPKYPNMVYVVTDTEIIQRKITNALPTYSIVYPHTNPKKIQFVNLNRFVIYDDVEQMNGYTTYIEFYNVLPRKCLWGSCTQPDVLNATDNCCYILNSMPPPPLPLHLIPAADPPLPTPAPVPVQTNNVSQPQNMTQQSLQIKLKYFFSNKDLNNQFLLKIIGTTIFFSSQRIAPKFLICFIVFFDDLEFYRYNRKKYPVTVKFFMQKINIVNYFRLHPSFTYLLQNLQQNQIATQEEMRYKSYLNLTDYEKDPEYVYFLASAQQIYKTNFLVNFAYYICLKLIMLILYLLQKKFQYFSKYYFLVRDHTKWWTMVVAIVQTNACNIAFKSFLQFQMSSFYTWNNKFSYLVCLLFLIISIQYVLMFYVLIYTFSSKKTSAVLLLRCKFKFLSFYLEPLLIQTRCFLKAIFHSFLIFNFKLQLLCFVFIDFSFILVNLRTKKYFQSLFMFLSCLLYIISLFFFDLYFYLEQQLIVIGTYRQLIGLVLMCSIFSIKLLVCLKLFKDSLLLLLQQFYHFICSSNSVKPKQEQKNQSNKVVLKKFTQLRKININEIQSLQQTQDRNCKFNPYNESLPITPKVILVKNRSRQEKGGSPRIRNIQKQKNTKGVINKREQKQVSANNMTKQKNYKTQKVLNEKKYKDHIKIQYHNHNKLNLIYNE